MSKYPQNLYHYTNCKSLESILTHKTIRFCPLSSVDDLQEEKAKDAVALGKRIFVSSWCADEQENIPMWEQYGDSFKGVRIKLPANPFQIYHYSPEELSHYVKNPDKLQMDTRVPIKDIVNPHHIVTPYNLDTDFLYPITYTDDIKYLYPQLTTVENGTETTQFSLLGKHKNTMWAYQKEWRYILTIYPFSINMMQQYINFPLGFQLLRSVMLNGLDFPHLDYYDMSIDDTCFAEMEITLGYKMPPESKDQILLQ